MGSNWLTLGYNDRFGEAECSGNISQLISIGCRLETGTGDWFSVASK